MVVYEVDYFHLPKHGETWLLTGVKEMRGWCFDTADACIKYALRRCVAKGYNPLKAIRLNANNMKIGDFLQ